MKAIIVALAMTAATVAHADGFVCVTSEGDLKIRVYNQVQPELGTRNAAVMVVSDTAVNAGRKTIAKFTAAHGTLTSRQLTYNAGVDLRFNDSGRKGELISGTRLGELSDIVLDIDASYAPNRLLADGEATTAELTLVKRVGGGADIVRDMECVRYVKGSK
jgi:hypothetical protein